MIAVAPCTAACPHCGGSGEVYAPDPLAPSDPRFELAYPCPALQRRRRRAALRDLPAFSPSKVRASSARDLPF